VDCEPQCVLIPMPCSGSGLVDLTTVNIIAHQLNKRSRIVASMGEKNVIFPLLQRVEHTYYLEILWSNLVLLTEVATRMEGLQKIGIVLAVYLILGIIFSLLLLIGLYSVHTHIIIYILYWFFQPVFIVFNILYHIWFY